MWGRVVVPDVYSDAAIGTEIDDIPFWIKRIGIVFLVGEKKNGIVVITLKGAAVHDKKFVPSLIYNGINGQVKSDAWVRKRFWVIRDSIIERILVLDQHILTRIER